MTLFYLFPTWRLSTTLLEWVSGPSLGAAANSFVIIFVHSALGITSTCIFTRVTTPQPDTSSISRTISMRRTFWEASCVRVSQIILWTSAHGSVVDNFTTCIRSTSIGAWIFTLEVLASLTTSAFIVRFTFVSTSRNGISDKGRLATADGPVVLDPTIGISSTWTWLAKLVTLSFRLYKGHIGKDEEEGDWDRRGFGKHF